MLWRAWVLVFAVLPVSGCLMIFETDFSYDGLEVYVPLEAGAVYEFCTGTEGEAPDCTETPINTLTLGPHDWFVIPMEPQEPPLMLLFARHETLGEIMLIRMDQAPEPTEGAGVLVIAFPEKSGWGDELIARIPLCTGDEELGGYAVSLGAQVNENNCMANNADMFFAIATTAQKMPENPFALMTFRKR